jgi:hypothetical protein
MRHTKSGKRETSFVNSGFEGSQAVPVRPSGRGNVCDRN